MFYYFISIWIALMVIAGIAYIVFKALWKATPKFRIKFPKWESDIGKKWKVLSVKQKFIVMVILFVPMAGAITYNIIKNQKRA